MPASKAQQRAVHKYTKENYDRFLVTMKPKGRLDIIKSHAAAQGESTNAFIGRAIQEAIERDAGGPQEHRDIFLHPDTLTAAQEAAEAAGEDLPTFLDRAIGETADRDALPKEVVFGRAVDVVAEHYDVSCWDILKELEGLVDKGGESHGN